MINQFVSVSAHFSQSNEVVQVVPAQDSFAEEIDSPASICSLRLDKPHGIAALESSENQEKSLINDTLESITLSQASPMSEEINPRTTPPIISPTEDGVTANDVIVYPRKRGRKRKNEALSQPVHLPKKKLSQSSQMIPGMKMFKRRGRPPKIAGQSYSILQQMVR